MNIFGTNLKEVRTKRGFTLKELSDLCNVSVSMLSKIEAGEKIPTIRVAGQIAASLSLSISDLAGDTVHSKRCVVIKADERQTLINPQTGMQGQLLSPGAPFSELDFIYSSQPPKSSSIPMLPHAVGSEEYFWVIEGQLTVILNKTETYTLHTGDSMYFRADVYHEIQNQTEEDCKYCLILHR